MSIKETLLKWTQPLFHLVVIVALYVGLFRVLEYEFTVETFFLVFVILTFLVVSGEASYALFKADDKRLVLIKNGASTTLALLEIFYFINYVDIMQYTTLFILGGGLLYGLLLFFMYLELKAKLPVAPVKKRKQNRKPVKVEETTLNIFLKSYMRVVSFFILTLAVFITYLYIMFAVSIAQGGN